jgi:hypothetical protein
MIGGFIITGNAPKKIAIRGMGPVLASSGITDFLADPFLELRSSSGALLQSNDNWKDTQQAEIESIGLAPNDNREAVIVTTLTPGSYTALLTGKGGTTGVGLVEIYDVNPGVPPNWATSAPAGMSRAGTTFSSPGLFSGPTPGTIGLRFAASDHR